MGGGIRASSSSSSSSSVSNNVKKMIQNLKEIYVDHTEDEIYSVLKECSMDPNETAQKLLHQDTFHEVKRRRERKPEPTNREVVDPRKSGPPSRGDRGRKGNHSSRHIVQGTGNVRNTTYNKEYGFNHAFDKPGSSVPVTQEGNTKEKTSSVIDIANGPVEMLSKGTKRSDSSKRPHSRSDRSKRPGLISGAKAHSISSTSDRVLVPSADTRGGHAAGAIKREVGIQRPSEEMKASFPAEHRSNASKMGGKSQAAGKFQATEILQSSSLNHGSSSSRPSSNYGSGSQQGMGSQKVGPNKEWKPKPTAAQGKPLAEPENSSISLDKSSLPQSVERTTDSEEVTNKLQQELESLDVRDAKNVIIPSHIHVPDAVRTVLNFGSFDTAFVISAKHSTEPQIEGSKSVAEANLIKEDVKEEHASSQNTSTPTEEVEAEYTDCSPAPEQAETSTHDDTSVPSSSVPECNDTKDTSNIPQNSSVHIPESYSFGAIPPVLGNQSRQLEGSQTQARDVSGSPGLVVQQPTHPSSVYARFYRSESDNDGRVSPFATREATSKYTVFPSHNSQSEGGNSLVLQPPPPPSLTPQTTGVMPTPIGVTQQPLPIFRQPPGIHMPHYPPNFIPYGHYFNPFYIPPPTMHQFLGNNAFPQQSQAGNVYPPPPPPPVTNIPATNKYPHSQYNKPGNNNAGNSAHMGVGVGGGYGPYVGLQAGFNPRSGNTGASEDLAVSQLKDNVYINGHQTEGSTVWFSGQGRDISNLPANAFYNLPPQPHHMTYAPTQAGQGAYAGVFHPLLQPSQPMPGTVDMVGPTASIYQQPPQQPPMNWPSNY